MTVVPIAMAAISNPPPRISRPIGFPGAEILKSNRTKLGVVTWLTGNTQPQRVAIEMPGHTSQHFRHPQSPGAQARAYTANFWEVSMIIDLATSSEWNFS